MKKKSAQLELTGAVATGGEVSGKGTLNIKISDLSKANLSVDCSKPGSVTLSVKSAIGLKLRKASTLTFSGGLKKDLKTGTLDGNVGLLLEVPKRVAMTLEQSFSKKGSKTSLSLTLRF